MGWKAWERGEDGWTCWELIAWPWPPHLVAGVGGPPQCVGRQGARFSFPRALGHRVEARKKEGDGASVVGRSRRFRVRVRVDPNDPNPNPPHHKKPITKQSKSPSHHTHCAREPRWNKEGECWGHVRPPGRLLSPPVFACVGGKFVDATQTRTLSRPPPTTHTTPTAPSGRPRPTPTLP